MSLHDVVTRPDLAVPCQDVQGNGAGPAAWWYSHGRWGAGACTTVSCEEGTGGAHNVPILHHGGKAEAGRDLGAVQRTNQRVLDAGGGFQGWETYNRNRGTVVSKCIA